MVTKVTEHQGGVDYAIRFVIMFFSITCHQASVACANLEYCGHFGDIALVPVRSGAQRATRAITAQTAYAVAMAAPKGTFVVISGEEGPHGNRAAVPCADR